MRRPPAASDAERVGCRRAAHPAVCPARARSGIEGPPGRRASEIAMPHADHLPGAHGDGGIHRGVEEAGLDIRAVLAVHELNDALYARRLGDDRCGALDNDRVAGILGADDAARVGLQVPDLARADPAGEHQITVVPHAPYRHRMGPAVGPDADHPVIARAAEPLDRPGPGQQAAAFLGALDTVAGHVRPTDAGDFHRTRFSALRQRPPGIPGPELPPSSGPPRGRHRPADRLTWASVKASPEEQLRLLELADLDAELGRIDHRRRGLPEHEELRTLAERDGQLRDSVAALEAEDGDLRRGQAKAEADVDQVRTRIDRDRRRLDAGQVSSPRDLENLQSEIASLERRQSDLEEIVLELMERREKAQQDHNAAIAERAQIAGSLAEVTARRDTALGELAEQARKADSRRAEVAAQEPAELLALYDRLRVQHGVGAAALRRGRCEGCHLSLNTIDLNTIRAAAPDEVLRCEECRRILVRTDESGL